MTAFDEALARIAQGADRHAEAAALVADLTLDERLELLDGDLDFWAGLADMIGGGYTEHTFPGASAPRLGIPGIAFSDGPRGVVIGDATCFPVSMARGAAWDPHLEERIGDAIGKELRAKGATFYGGVCVNLLRHPAWGRAQETYGEDPVLLGEMGAALTRGAQRHVIACVKHFALNSMENARFKVDVTVDERSLHEVYLPHFRQVVDEGVGSVMSAYNSVNGSWAGESHELLTEILRDRWGFDGMVISDFIYGLRDAAASVRAGLDVEMPFRMVRHQQLREQLAAGDVSWDEVDAACERIVATLLRFAPVWAASPGDPAHVASAEHVALATEAARRSIVLLRNEGALLPLDAGQLGKVAVIGALAATPNLGDLGSSRVAPPTVVTPLDGLRAALGDVEVVFDAGADPAQAAAVAAGADVAIVVVGFTHRDEGEYVGLEGSSQLHTLYPPQPPGTTELLRAALERGASDERAFGQGGDRSSLSLHPEHEDLLLAVTGAQPRTVGVVMGGSAVVMERWRQAVPAILLLWYPGMGGGTALADVLLGAHAPTGRLPFTIPTDPEHLPPFDRDATAVTYDRWVGYRRLARDGHDPAYPFGFGLTYTDFALADLGVERLDDHLAVSVSVTNTGARHGDDVVQIYAGHTAPSVEREAYRLVAFARTGDLTAGASRTVRVTVPTQRLALWWPEQGRWHVEPGEHVITAARWAGDPRALHRHVHL